MGPETIDHDDEQVEPEAIGRRSLLAKLAAAAAAGTGLAAAGAALQPGVAGAVGQLVGDGGTTNDGVEGKTSAGNRSGVYGHHDGTATGWGVFGVAGGGSGISTGTAGVIGDSHDADGVAGTSAASSGVYGTSAGPTSAGVLGENISASSGWGVFGRRGGTPEIFLPPAGTVGASVSAVGVVGASDLSPGVLGLGDIIGVKGVQGLGVASGITAAGVVGEAATYPGVAGASGSSHGVSGTSASSSAGGGAGVSAANTSSGPALSASAASGTAVVGLSTSGVGVLASGGRAPLALAPAAATGAPTSGAHNLGEISLDSAGALYVCTTGGTPGTWQQVSYGSGSGGGFVPIDPVRIVDTRSGAPPDPPGEHKLAAGEELLVAIRGTAGIPNTATAVVLNITAVDPTANGGYMSLYPANITHTSANPPTTSNLNFNAGAIVANTATVRVATTGANTGKIKVFNFNGQTHVILDVCGYYS